MDGAGSVFRIGSWITAIDRSDGERERSACVPALGARGVSTEGCGSVPPLARSDSTPPTAVHSLAAIVTQFWE